MPANNNSKHSTYSIFSNITSFALRMMIILLINACMPDSPAVDQAAGPIAMDTAEGVNVTITPTKAVAVSTASATHNNIQEPIDQDKTRVASFTETPIATPTPEFTSTPEAMTQERIRAEILAAGVNFDDLASSKDKWTRSHVALETIQNYIDNHNFGRETEGAVTTVVIGLEGVQNLDQLDQALLTDGGWKLTSYAKLAYKSVDGNWKIVKVPLSAYHLENELIWPKSVSVGGQNYLDANHHIYLDNNGNFDASFLNYWSASSIGNNYHWGTGSFIKLFTAWPENPKYANNDCVLGNPPRYSEEQLIEFRKTGDPSIFGYQDHDGYYILWPLVTFNAGISALTNYNQN